MSSPTVDHKAEAVNLSHDSDNEVDMVPDSVIMSYDDAPRQTLDRSCHNTHDFDEILVASQQDDLSCVYCINYVSTDFDQFKNHLLRVHYTFSYSFVIDDHKVCVLACRRGCITRPKQGNRSHFHCPACGRTYGRKPALAHHINVWKGRCLPMGEMPAKDRSKRQNLRNKIPQPGELKRRFSEENGSFSHPHATAFIDSHFRSGIPGEFPYTVSIPKSSYTVVVENEEQSNVDEDATIIMQGKNQRESTGNAGEQLQTDLGSHMGETGPLSRIFSQTVGKREDDAATYFGKTVTSRIRGLSPKKQAEAMQKIMQILFEIEYSNPD